MAKYITTVVDYFLNMDNATFTGYSFFFIIGIFLVASKIAINYLDKQDQ